MGWSRGGPVTYKGQEREVGYSVQAVCDHPGCKHKIDRGLAYACGGEHGESGGVSCNGYFCEGHKGNRVPAEGEDALADPYDYPKVKSVYVCNECFKHHKEYVKEMKAERRPKRRKTT